MTRAYIGLGSNMGDRMENLAEALEKIGHLDGVHVLKASTAFETEAWPDASQPHFANAVAEVETALEPFELLGALQEVESEMGRESGSERYAPRVIDLDILLFGDEEVNAPDLVIPHEGLLQRDFAVTPLFQIAPDLHLPDGTPISDSLPADGRVIRELGPIEDLGEEHGQPLLTEEWVAVAETVGSTAVVAGPDPGIIYQASVLSEEGIPVSWEPFDPTNMSDPIGTAIPVRLLVPADDAERARQVLADVEAAVPVLDDDVEWAIESEADEQDIE